MTEVQNSRDERLDLVREWLKGLAEKHALQLDTLEPASADAGFRRYFRIGSASEAKSFIVMDAPPGKEDIHPFIRVDAIGVRAGLNVPKILEADAKQGFMLLSDLGRETFLEHFSHAPKDAPALFDAATSALVAFQAVSEPGLVPEYSEAKIREELSLFPEWYVKRHRGTDFDEREQKIWDTVCDRLVASMTSESQVLVHRDFMPRNLMVSEPLPGVLDFQDALYGPVSYDIASLMRDAFISWDEAFTLDISIRYWQKAKAAGIPVPSDFGQYWQQIEWTGMQRHLKILGIFARLNYRDGKPRYLADTPRFIAYVRHVAGRYEQLKPILSIIDRLEGPSGTEAWSY